MATKKKASVNKKSKNPTTKKVSAKKVVLVTTGLLGTAGLLYFALRAKGKEIITQTVEKIVYKNKPKTTSSLDSSQSASSASTQTKANPRFNASEVAELVRQSTYAIQGRETKMFQLALNALVQIGNLSQYEQANREYLKIGFVSRTIVSHLLETFGRFNAFRTKLYTQFLRIGLKQSKNEKNEIIWSLAGVEEGTMVQTVAPVRGRFVKTGKLTPVIKEGTRLLNKGKTASQMVFVQTPESATAMILPASTLREV